MLEFLAANWLWIAIGAAFVWMHTRGGGCGMHGSHGSHGQSEQHDHDQRTEPPLERVDGSHRHRNDAV